MRVIKVEAPILELWGIRHELRNPSRVELGLKRNCHFRCEDGYSTEDGRNDKFVQGAGDNSPPLRNRRRDLECPATTNADIRVFLLNVHPMDGAHIGASHWM